MIRDIRLRRFGGVYRFDPAPQGRVAQIVLPLDLGRRLASVVQVDDLALELVGEAPGVLRVGHAPLFPKVLMKLSR